MSESSVTTKKLLFVFTSAPYSNASGQEGLDALISATTLEQDVSALFLHDGVFQLKRDQDVSGSALKQVTKTFQALPDFGVEQVYVYQTSMAARGLTPDDLMIATTALEVDAVADLIQNHFRVLTF